MGQGTAPEKTCLRPTTARGFGHRSSTDTPNCGPESSTRMETEAPHVLIQTDTLAVKGLDELFEFPFASTTTPDIHPDEYEFTVGSNDGETEFQPNSVPKDVLSKVKDMVFNRGGSLT